MPQQVQPPSNAPPGPFQISPQFPFPVAQPQPQMELPQVSPEMQFALNYAEEIKQMFMSSDFKES